MKRTVIGIFALGAVAFLSACNVGDKTAEVKEGFADRLAQVSIPFEWFKKEEIQKEEVVIPTVDGLTLEEEEIPNDMWNGLKENLLTIAESLKDKKTYTRITNKEVSVGNLANSSSAYESMDWSSLDAVMETLGETEHQWFHSFNVRGIGRQSFKGQDAYVSLVELNAVNDTEKFHVIPLEVRTDEEGKIRSITKAGETYDSAHTIKPLSEDAFLYNNTHLSFLDEWNDMVKTVKTIDLESETFKDEITTVHGVLNLESEPDALENFASQLSEEYHIGFTAYVLDDANLASETLYEVTVSNRSGYHAYTIVYDRGTRNITKLETGTFLKEER